MSSRARTQFLQAAVSSRILRHNFHVHVSKQGLACLPAVTPTVSSLLSSATPAVPPPGEKGRHKSHCFCPFVAPVGMKKVEKGFERLSGPIIGFAAPSSLS